MLAKKSNVTHKHGAAIICGNAVFSCGYNRHVTSNLSKASTIHAEMDALYHIPKSLKSRLHLVDILIIRVKYTKQGECVLRYSKPCSHCLNCLAHKGLRRVYYSNQEGIICSEELSDVITNHISAGYKRSCKQQV